MSYNHRQIFFHIVFAGISVLWGSMALAHGGKHAEASATAFKALQEATVLYDQLLASGKLDPNWETGLIQVEIAVQQAKDGNEFMVSFHRREGSPKTVNIFFSQAGKYTGSNFSDE